MVKFPIDDKELLISAFGSRKEIFCLDLIPLRYPQGEVKFGWAKIQNFVSDTTQSLEENLLLEEISFFYSEAEIQPFVKLQWN